MIDKNSPWVRQTSTLRKVYTRRCVAADIDTTCAWCGVITPSGENYIQEGYMADGALISVCLFCDAPVAMARAWAWYAEGEDGCPREGFYSLTDHGGRVQDTAYVEPPAYVSGGAWVTDRAYVVDDAQVYGNAWVGGYAMVTCGARVCGTAVLLGRVCVGRDAFVSAGRQASGRIEYGKI